MNDVRPWSATSAHPLLKTPYFSVIMHDVTVNDGTQRDYYTIEFARPAIGVVPCRDGEVLLVRQYRFIVDEFVWAIPSGGVAEGETLESAALRELEEETGYTAGTVEPLLSCYASYGCSNQRFEIFRAIDVRDTGNAFDYNEVLETRWFTLDELRDLIRRNGVVDNLSLSPLLYLLLLS